jgi:hypothetical protein
MDFLILIRELFIPIFIGIISYIFVSKLDDWKSRKKYSLLGASIMESLIEEVSKGVQIMEHLKNKDELFPGLLPTKSWNGISTINDDVLIRIIQVSKNKKYTHFHPSEIRIHTKNYFNHIAFDWNNNMIKLQDKNTLEMDVKSYAKNLLNKRGFLEGSNGVLNMLHTTKLLLIRNSKRIIPR